MKLVRKIRFWLGSLLVQLASAAGARVIGAARGAGKLELINQLGADTAVDYSSPDWTERVREMSGGGVQVAFADIGSLGGWQALLVATPRCGTVEIEISPR